MKNVTVFTISHDLINVFYPSSSVFIIFFLKAQLFTDLSWAEPYFSTPEFDTLREIKFIFANKLKDL